MGRNSIDVVKLLKDAEEAADSRANGLLDHEDFVGVIRRLLTVTRELLGECEQLEHQRDAIIRRIGIFSPQPTMVPRPDVEDQLQVKPEELQLSPLNVDRPESLESRIRDIMVRSIWPTRQPTGDV